MGFTHYWYLNPNANDSNYDAALAAVKKIVAYGERQGILAGWDGTGSPETSGKISFNGKDDDGCETFFLPKKPSDLLKERFVQKDDRGLVFNFCKTRRGNYDIYVTACLMVMKAHLCEDIEISSDGGTDAFFEGFRLACRVLGEDEPSYEEAQKIIGQSK